MKKVLGLLLLFSQTVSAQYHITLRIVNDEAHQPVAGASVIIDEPNKGAVSDSTGIVFINNMKKGNYLLRITCLGYFGRELKVAIPSSVKDTILITLEEDAEVLDNVVVSSSRTNSRIKDLPTRVEVLGIEDMEEETSMHPSNVAMLLSEASGIQTQQTSASSGNIQIRILGLDGRYTQLLKDGFPMYSGFSNGLSIMQIPPLDLKQVELIKGSSSSLYGGDAIAGIINFISKKPQPKPEWNLLANETSRAGTDMGSFYASRNKHWGITLLNTFNSQDPRDIHNDGFTVLPKLTAFTISPKLFWYPDDSATVSLAVNSNYDNRAGGDLYAVENGPTPSHPYIETSKSNRNYYQLEYEQHLSGGNLLTIRNSTSFFNRDIKIMDYTFSGKQASTFSEISYLYKSGHHTTVAGLNFITDQFNENRRTDSLNRDYHFITPGIFVQDDWTMNKYWVIETGIRNDYQNGYGNFLLPRISVLYKASQHWSYRAGGGLGYKPANIFDAQTEETAYKNILPIGAAVKAERSAGINADINYGGTLGEDTKLTLDQSFFYTRVSNPLVLDSFCFINAPKPYITRGFESSIRLKQDNWTLFAGYTYVDARTGMGTLPYIPLAPRSKIVFDLSTERDNDYRIALEAFYTGPQYLYDGTKTRDYWVTGLLIEKVMKWATVILNFEDLTDTRQTRFGPVVIPPFTNPAFREIYAPLEGFMANLAIKIKIL
ncbi:MAG TPA: TonB-dependent receptor [Chitinophagaceae bacterium]|nr:TonB-dependent receptor [Chitinophagaceae bacterium]